MVLMANGAIFLTSERKLASRAAPGVLKERGIRRIEPSVELCLLDVHIAATVQNGALASLSVLSEIHISFLRERREIFQYLDYM